MIALNDKYLIGKGKSRSCYVHPDDDGKIIKIVHKVPSQKPDANDKELRHYQYLLKRHGRLDFIGDYFGIAETSLGKGSVWQCFRDDDRKISKTAFQALCDPKRYNRAMVIKKIERFFQMMIEKNIQLFDLNRSNLLIRILPGGSLEVVCADIKGRYINHEFIPLSTYIPFFPEKNWSEGAIY